MRAIYLGGNEFDIDDIISELDDNGYIVLKAHNIEHREKIQKLLEELYPSYNERPEFITLNY